MFVVSPTDAQFFIQVGSVISNKVCFNHFCYRALNWISGGRNRMFRQDKVGRLNSELNLTRILITVSSDHTSVQRANVVEEWLILTWMPVLPWLGLILISFISTFEEQQVSVSK